MTCLAVLKNAASRICLGSEGGDILTAELHGSKTASPEQVRSIEAKRLHQKHFGPITSLDFNPLYDSPDDSLLLSTSVDWSCSLWSDKHPDKPLMTFEYAEDYIYDAKWSPIHVGMFATVDGSGKLCLWNISDDTELPVSEIQVGNGAVNKVRWTQDGQKLLVGDSHGVVSIFSVLPKLAHPRNDEKLRVETKVIDAVTRNGAQQSMV